MEDADPLIKPLREHYFPFSNRFEGRDYSLFDEPHDYGDDIDFKVEERISLNGNLREVFPEAERAFEQKEVYGNETLREFSNQLDKGEIPKELEFFSGGEQNIGGLYGCIRDHNLLNQGNQEFIEYLATEECQDALERDGISIHIPTGNIFINSQNTGENLYTFLNNQQDTTKKEISRNALSEFFHNLSWQALTNDNDSLQVKFEAATELVKNINRLLQQQIYENKRKTTEIGKKIVEQLNNKEKETVKSEIEKAEEKVVDDIISNYQKNYVPEFAPPTVKTEEKIDEDRLEWNRNFLATELAKKERDFEIIDDIEAKEQHDLIKNAIDPSDGLLTNEEIDPTDYNRTIKN